MDDKLSGKQLLPKSIFQLLKYFLMTISFSLLFTSLVHKALVKNLDVYHTILEAFCIFTALTIFLSVWYTCQHYEDSHYILGFGFLAVAVFDALHTYYYLKLDLNQNSYYDLSTRFWIIGRFFEAIVLLLSTRQFKMRRNKWISLAATIGVCLFVCATLVYHHDDLPVLLTEEGVTPVKVFLEYVVIILYFISLFRIRANLASKSDNLTYQYIFLAILTGISAEFTFTLYESTRSFPFAFGHILKIITYFFLLHGIFKSSIIYPYKKLKERNQLLKNLNDTILRDQEKLIQQEKLALLGQMGAGIVHETRNFLTTIKGTSQLIAHVTNEERVRDHAIAIDRNVNEVNKIISEFLFLSKPRETQLVEIPLSRILSGIKAIVESDSLLRGIPVEFRLSENERNLLCDEAQLKQVILNLCKNAAEAMTGRQDARMVIETGLKTDRNEMYISISDNGKGIPEEDLKRLGTPFYTTKKSGTGLGLCVSYKIIENHRGHIEVKSKINRGTVFTICLPCNEPENN